MKKYEAPQIEIDMFQIEDVITASGDTWNSDDAGEW